MSLSDAPLPAPISEPPRRRKFDISSIDSFLSSPQGVKSVLQLHGEDAVAMAEVLDRALASVDLDVAQRKMYTFILRKLCGDCGILPKSYILTDGLEITSLRPYASGGFGDVWEGRFKGFRVAIKTLRTYTSDKIPKVTKRFCKEVIIWKHLCHPNVLPFLGVSAPPFPSSMVSVWMAHGNIVEYVKTNPQANRLALLSDVASGLHYLHTMDLVHGDLKGANILINQDLHACLADFGLMTIVSDRDDRYTAITSANGGGTVRWMAPELLNSSVPDTNPSKECDVYAMAMVIFEVMTGNVPFHQYGNIRVIPMVVIGVRPQRPTDSTVAGLSDSLWQMIELCWHQQSGERPVIGLVLDHLTEAAQHWDPPSSTIANLGVDVCEDSDASSTNPDSSIPAELRVLLELHDQGDGLTKAPITCQGSKWYYVDDIPTAVKPSSPCEVPEVIKNGPKIDIRDSSIRKPFAHPTPAQSLDPASATFVDSSRSATLGSSLDLRQPRNLKKERSFLGLRGARPNGSQDSIESTGSQENPKGAVTFFRRTLLRSRSEKRAISLTENGTTLVNRFAHTRKSEDLEQAIVYYREALDLRPLGNPDRPNSLNKLAHAFHDRFKWTHKLEDLEKVISYDREALDLRPPGNPQRSSSLYNLAIDIHERFKRTHKIADLEEAIDYHRQALELRPPGNSHRSCSLNNLALVVHDRFKQTHKLEDLKDAIAYDREALELRPLGDPDRPRSLYNLAIDIHDHFKRTHKLEELEEAIIYYREALSLHPSGDPDRSSSLNNLANSIHDRFKRTHKLEDLEDVIAYHREALNLRPPGSPYRSRSLNNLARAIHDRFKRTYKFEDLEEAIACDREALELRPPGNPDRSTSLHNLALNIYDRFNLSHQFEDLEESITYHRQALELRPPGNPDRLPTMENLSRAVRDRFERTQRLEDLHEATDLLSESAATVAPP